VIARVLVERGYIEEVGLGIRRMREEMTRLGLPEPEFREDGFSFVITFRSIAPREGAARLSLRPICSGRCWSGARSTSASTAGCSMPGSTVPLPAATTCSSPGCRSARR
jgi:hypothetical protein